MAVNIENHDGYMEEFFNEVRSPPFPIALLLVPLPAVHMKLLKGSASG